ncbi:MAG: MvdC/MvdD family ATP grasp protein [Terriglobales bacterium]
MVLIITKPEDAHAQIVEHALTASGTRCARLDSLPVAASAGFGLAGGARGTLEIVLSGRRVLLHEEVDTVWNRRRPAWDLPAGLSRADRAFAEGECAHFLASIASLLAGVRWVNPIEMARRANLKPFQLQRARSLGLRAPVTLVTTDPAEACRFADEAPWPVVYKALSAIDRTAFEATPRTIYTSVVTAKQIHEHADQVSVAPCMFQEYVSKRVEIRATIVGSEIFAAEIHSQESERSRVDWRRYDFPNTPYRAHRLPDEVSERLLSLMRDLGLLFGCADMILTPDGEYVFLEINEAGQWYWVEELTGLPITNGLVHLLAGGGRC